MEIPPFHFGRELSLSSSGYYSTKIPDSIKSKDFIFQYAELFSDTDTIPLQEIVSFALRDANAVYRLSAALCDIHFDHKPFYQNRFRAVCSLTSTGHVDFVGPLAGTRQHDRLLCRNIHKTARNRRYTAFAVPDDGQAADAERRNIRLHGSAGCRHRLRCEPRYGPLHHRKTAYRP